MAQNANTKRAVNVAAGLVIIVLAFFALRSCFRTEPKPQAQAQPSVNYTQNICEDAYKTENHRYENENPEYIDVILREGCFSGYVSIPKAWTDWQRQMLHPASDDWLAMWYQGWQAPAGPYWAGTVNSQRIQFQDVPTKLVRLEGKGTLRIYRITATSYPER
jgi:hypothetical protein